MGDYDDYASRLFELHVRDERIDTLTKALRGLVEAEQFMQVADPGDSDDAGDANELMVDAMSAALAALEADDE